MAGDLGWWVLRFASAALLAHALACGDGEGGSSGGTAGGGAGGSGAKGGTGATGSGATGSGATGSGATGSGATGSGATGSGATGSGATGSGATGSGGSTGGSGGTGAGGSGGSSAGCPTSTAVVLCVDFDQTPLGDYTQASFDKDWPSSQWEQGLGAGRASIVDGTEAWSGRSLRLKYPQGVYGPDKDAIQAWIDLPQSYDELFVAYRVRFSPGFDFVKGGKLPGLLGGKGNTGGEKPTGTDGWSARMMWRKDGAVVQYVYHPDQPTIYGEDFPWDVGGARHFSPGVWHSVEHRIVMNAPGQKNGVVQGWFDGVLALDEKTIRFRDVSTFAIDAFYISTFFGGNDSTWAPSKDVYVSFDDFIISKAPITH